MITINFNNVLSGRVGQKHGLTRSKLNQVIKKHAHICRQIQKERQVGQLPFMDLPYQSVNAIWKLARQKARRYENFVLLGIGGSALGPIALHRSLNHPFHNVLDRRQRKNWPRLFILDNVDPEEINALFKLIDPKKTIFNVITKSGTTAEPVSCFMLALSILKRKLGARYKNNLIVTTDPKKGFLRRMVEQEKLVSFEVPPGVGGRYSVLSPVGLVPAAFTGIDIKKVLAGAAKMDRLCQRAKPGKNPAYVSSVINFLFDHKKNKNMLVMMPYSSALKDMADWFRQLWAESLGKKYNVKGRKVFTGSTPLKALGVTDQHSQVQLYNEGPNDKLIVFIEPGKYRTKLTIPSLFKNVPEAGFLAGKTFNQLIRAEKKGTEIALTDNQRPNYTIKLPNISPESVGALFYFLELQTAYAGKLYNVNAFDQPGVEAGKIATLKLMGKKM